MAEFRKDSNMTRADMVPVSEEMRMKLIAYRKKHILNQREMAKLINYSSSAYNRVECGKAHYIKLNHKKAIEDLFDADNANQTENIFNDNIDHVEDGTICFNNNEEAVEVEEIESRAKMLLKIECALNNCTEEEFILKNLSENTKKVLNVLNK